MGSHHPGAPTETEPRTGKAVVQLVLIGLLVGGLAALTWLEWPTIIGRF